MTCSRRQVLEKCTVTLTFYTVQAYVRTYYKFYDSSVSLKQTKLVKSKLKIFENKWKINNKIFHYHMFLLLLCSDWSNISFLNPFEGNKIEIWEQKRNNKTKTYGRGESYCRFFIYFWIFLNPTLRDLKVDQKGGSTQTNNPAPSQHKRKSGGGSESSVEAIIMMYGYPMHYQVKERKTKTKTRREKEKHEHPPLALAHDRDGNQTPQVWCRVWQILTPNQRNKHRERKRSTNTTHRPWHTTETESDPPGVVQSATNSPAERTNETTCVHDNDAQN